MGGELAGKVAPAEPSAVDARRGAPRISVFPKCWFDDFLRGERDYVLWVHQAKELGAEGLEHYDGFFFGYEPERVQPVLEAQREEGLPTSMLCFSPDFTHPDPAERERQVERQKRAIDLAVRLGTRYCRTLSGQRYPGLSVKEGVARAAECIRRSLDYAASREVVLCIENHYKDGTWRFPEFAQSEAVLLELLDAVGESPWFGVQYDPSNATVGGYDPVAFLERVKHRVVTMQASDRHLLPGTTLDELRAQDGSVGYPDKLRHGEIGRGMNDYDAIFRILVEIGYSGWISVEDGMEGLDEMRRSVAFLKDKRREYFTGVEGA